MCLRVQVVHQNKPWYYLLSLDFRQFPRIAARSRFSLDCKNKKKRLVCSSLEHCFVSMTSTWECTRVGSPLVMIMRGAQERRWFRIVQCLYGTYCNHTAIVLARKWILQHQSSVYVITQVTHYTQNSTILMYVACWNSISICENIDLSGDSIYM